MISNTPSDFWRFVRKSEEVNGCWVWTGKSSGYRYGAFNIKGRVVMAHRFSWEMANGEIPNGLHVLHHCDNGFCVKPSHLFVGTHLDNMNDKNRKGRANPPIGSRNAWAKLTENEVKTIRRRYKRGETQVSLASEYGVSQTTISKMVLRVSWKHI